jgi:hypothetical protein
MTRSTSSTIDDPIDTLVRYGYLEPTARGAYRLSKRLPTSLILTCS